jgi:nitrogenase molybdenum-iron protein alpha/beta subunit
VKNPNRWKAYKIVDRLKIEEMEKDYLRNCIVNDSEARIKNCDSGQIVRIAFSRLVRTKTDRTRVLGYKGVLMLAGSIV